MPVLHTRHFPPLKLAIASIACPAGKLLGRNILLRLNQHGLAWGAMDLHQLVLGVFCTSLLLFSQSEVIVSASRVLQFSKGGVVTKDEVEADFISWVASVGAHASRRINRGNKVVVGPPQVVYYVDVAGFGNFKTVQEAVNAVPEDNSVPVLINVKPGTYRYIDI